jgi:hypothetical protein
MDSASLQEEEAERGRVEEMRRLSKERWRSGADSRGEEEEAEDDDEEEEEEEEEAMEAAENRGCRKCIYLWTDACACMCLHVPAWARWCPMDAWHGMGHGACRLCFQMPVSHLSADSPGMAWHGMHSMVCLFHLPPSTIEPMHVCM